MVVRKLGGSNFELYSKGAPEMIASLCEPSSGEFMIISFLKSIIMIFRRFEFIIMSSFP